ncbi:hypothetical protein, partial [Serratia marcescens]
MAWGKKKAEQLQLVGNHFSNWEFCNEQPDCYRYVGISSRVEKCPARKVLSSIGITRTGGACKFTLSAGIGLNARSFSRERVIRMSACSPLRDLKRNLSEPKYEHEPDGAGYEHQSGQSTAQVGA